MEYIDKFEKFQGIIGTLIDIDPLGRWRERRGWAVLWDQRGIIAHILSPEEITEQLKARLEQKEGFVLPGFIDCHCHYPQIRAVGKVESALLSWLKNEIWPEEIKYKNPEYSKRQAELFLTQLIESGTTAALVFGSQFREATDILFRTAEEVGFFLISGLTLQDRNTVPELEFPPSSIERDVDDLIRRWHRKERSRYAITPRFSPACSEELLTMCGNFLKEDPTLYLHTHINENVEEIQLVKRLFPQVDNYLESYERFGLLTPRTVLAHSIYTGEDELAKMAHYRCNVAHCPSSNLFLGSGFFPYRKHRQRSIPVGVGTDIGAGITFSPFFEMKYFHLVQMQLPLEDRFFLTPEEALALITIEGAKCLNLERELGNFEIGKWADFTVISAPPDDPYTAELQSSLSPKEFIFRSLFTATPALIRETYLKGQKFKKLS